MGIREPTATLPDSNELCEVEGEEGRAKGHGSPDQKGHGSPDQKRHGSPDQKCVPAPVRRPKSERQKIGLIGWGSC